jgi:hypothetical protein
LLVQALNLGRRKFGGYKYRNKQQFIDTVKKSASDRYSPSHCGSNPFDYRHNNKHQQFISHTTLRMNPHSSYTLDTKSGTDSTCYTAARGYAVNNPDK